MKLIHLSDLHLGKRVNGFSMLEDQKYILGQILSMIREESPQAVLIAGDVYDKTVPPTEAVSLFDDFLVDLSRLGLQVFVISGNHDSPERIAFGGRLMDASGIHMSPVYDGHVMPVELKDEYGPCRIYMLPFVKPATVRQVLPDEKIESYTDALRCAIDHMNVDQSCRNVLVAHQFVTGAQRSESEEISVGGVDNVDATVFAPFDYTALGHIHMPQIVGDDRIRYCGTPLKYALSERDQHKSVCVVEMGGKGSVQCRRIPLNPLRDMRQIRGSYNELTLKANYVNTNTDDYIHVVLTDETDVPQALARLRTIYPNIMKLDYDNQRTRNSEMVCEMVEDAEQKSEMEMFEALYEKQNGHPMSSEQRAYSTELFDRVREEAL